MRITTAAEALAALRAHATKHNGRALMHNAVYGMPHDDGSNNPIAHGENYHVELLVPDHCDAFPTHCVRATGNLQIAVIDNATPQQTVLNLNLQWRTHKGGLYSASARYVVTSNDDEVTVEPTWKLFAGGRDAMFGVEAAAYDTSVVYAQSVMTWLATQSNLGLLVMLLVGDNNVDPAELIAIAEWATRQIPEL